MKNGFVKLKNWWANHRPTKRRLIQFYTALLFNSYLKGYITGDIFKGISKNLCTPGLNCYSCPGAVTSCPLGALQNSFSASNKTVPFYMLGILMLYGIMFGRWICGWLCPFGLLQDLLHKIPLFKKRKQLPYHSILKYGKYLALFGLAIIGSAFLFTGFAKVPAFCKYLCPSGTFMGALPLLATNEALRSQAGGLFFWKFGILIFIVLLSIKVYRPFCQYLCPLGAIYGWFNRFSLVQIRWEKDSCISCMACRKACPVNLTPEQISVSPECIKCGQCVKACPTGCLNFQSHKPAAK